MSLIELLGAPWVVPGDSNNGSRRCAIWTAKGDFRIATCDSPHLSAEANRRHARAIAELPNLLAALGRVEFIADYTLDRQPVGLALGLLKILTEARAAIALLSDVPRGTNNPKEI